MGRGKGRWRHIHGVPEEGPISQADQEPLRIGENSNVSNLSLNKLFFQFLIESWAQDSDDEISHLEWETVRVRFLKAGTVQRLVESLANDDGELESTYINVFLATYRAFTTPREVLELLLSRYDALDEGSGALTGEQHRKTLVQALHVWLDAYPGDWKSPPNHPLLSRVLDFTHRRLPGSELELKARHRLHRFQREDQIGKIVIKLLFVSLQLLIFSKLFF